MNDTKDSNRECTAHVAIGVRSAEAHVAAATDYRYRHSRYQQPDHRRVQKQILQKGKEQRSTGFINPVEYAK